MAPQSKDELNALIKKAGISAKSARKLHEANGTGETTSPAPNARGHGAPTSFQPDLGDEL